MERPEDRSIAIHFVSQRFPGGPSTKEVIARVFLGVDLCLEGSRDDALVEALLFSVRERVDRRGEVE
jgi:hypothetical protein